MKYEKSLERLIEESMKEEPPTRYEERALYWKMQNGVEGAKDELVTRNMRFVMHLAKGFTGHGVDLGDLVQEGAVAMCQAADKWTPHRGMRFSGYAGWYIKNALKALLCTSSGAVVLPKINYSHSKAKACLHELQAELCRMPTNEEFKERSGIPGHAGSVMMVLNQPWKSLEDDMIKGESNSGRKRDFVVDKNADTSTEAERNNLRKWLEGIMLELNDRERDVIVKRFGWYDDNDMILDEIGAIRGVSREAIRQTQSIAMRKMKAAIVQGGIQIEVKRAMEGVA